jgi:hypothetical protein
MPAVTPAEPHDPERYGSSHAIQPARLRAPPQPAAAQWSKPPGLPCRRSRRQSHTIPNGTGVPTPSSPHDCALHLNPPRPVGADQRVRPLFSYLRVLSALCGLLFPCPPCRVRCGAGFLASGPLSSRPWPPLPTALMSTNRQFYRGGRSPGPGCGRRRCGIRPDRLGVPCAGSAGLARVLEPQPRVDPTPPDARRFPYSPFYQCDRLAYIMLGSGLVVL